MNQIPRIINKLSNLDWRSHLFSRTGYAPHVKETSGKTLEFLGTSGVGKTSLYREAMIRWRSRWFFAYQLDSFQRNTPSGQIDEVLMQILRSKIARTYAADGFDPWHSLDDLRLSVQVMQETMLVFHTAHARGIVFDEGLFRHFPSEILKLGRNIPPALWHNRAFIYLRARSPETVLSRVREREEAATSTFRMRPDDQILAGILNDQEMFQSIVEMALLQGCPVLVVDAEDPLEDTIKKVEEFERTLGQQFETQAKMTPSSLSQSENQ